MKQSLAAFLAQNPFERPWTLGFFFREKMRAIHRLAPDQPIQRVLEIGGGQSGLARILYPDASIINTDLDPKYADAPCNRQPGVQFIPADATALPFEDNTFDLVTMFDLLEHVPDDRAAASEAARVLKPGGYLMVTTPRENWRYPHYKILTPICPDEAVLLEEWGHVRRGYSPADLESLIPLTNRGWAGFISPATSLNHDLSFSRLPKSVRVLACTLISPLTWWGYWQHSADEPGTESTSVWQKPAATS